MTKIQRLKTTRACTSQPLHWDRGRPARREREARANGFEIELFRDRRA